ncbi:glycosyltransferase family 39 protein [Aureispira]|nr:glycosyltransferase family 39 protein [Aureispira sp.]
MGPDVFKSLNKNKRRQVTPFVILCIFLSLFVISKIFTLFTPLFHDEIGIYGRLLFYMLEHGPSMHPGDVTPEFGRGHPLFFTYFLSVLTSWTGGSYVSARCIILLLSVALVLMTYIFAKKISNKNIALTACIILLFQPIFYSQSTMILPEIMLSLLAIISIYFYINKRYFLYFIFSGLLILTKETGIVLFASIGLYEWYKDRFKISLNLILTIIKWSLPFSLIILFFAIQKLEYGWFLYPFHTSLISFNPVTLFIRFLLNISNLFLDQGRFMLTIALIYSLWKIDKEKRKYLIDKYFLLLSVCFVMIAFSSINYVMTRYLLMILPLVLIFIVAIIKESIFNSKYLVLYFLLTLPFQFSFYTFRQDNDMGYLIVVENMRKSIAELDKLTEGKPAMIWAQFPELNALDFIHDGYVSNPNYVLRTVYSDSIDYILISGREYLKNDKLINDMKYDIENKVDSILNDETAYKNSGFELMYDKTLFYNRQRIFKTNNFKKRDKNYKLIIKE